MELKMQDNDIKKFNPMFLYNLYSNPVCKHLTSSDFSIKADNYDFANAPQNDACSSDDRLISVKSQRKSQVFYCLSSETYSSCSYYSPRIDFLARTEIAGNFIDLVTLKVKGPNGSFVDICVICDTSKGSIFNDFYSTNDSEKNMQIYRDFIAQLDFKTQSIVHEISTASVVAKPQKKSYLSRLIPSLAAG
jgi:hypothetical protein